MTFLFTVSAGERVDALLGTIAGTVTNFLAVDALDLGLHVLALGLLLFAMLFMS